MRRGGAAILGALALWASLLAPAHAHPLGNFTVNRFSRIEIVGSELRLLYIVDFAEIPTVQEKQRIAADAGYVGRLVGEIDRGLSLEIDGRRTPLGVVDHSLRFSPGQAGLETMRLEILLATPLSPGRQRARYHDGAFAGRLGWREVVVRASQGARLVESSAPESSISDELRTYPDDMLASPSDVGEASFAFVPGTGGATAQPALAALPVLRLAEDRFAGLIETKDFSAPVVALAALAAVLLGGLHALSPGHGKAMMAGYLVGARGTWRHAALLGVSITASHTAGVFALGGITLYGAQLVTPERLYPWLTLASGLMVVAIGASLVATRARALWREPDGDSAYTHDHASFFWRHNAAHTHGLASFAERHGSQHDHDGGHDHRHDGAQSAIGRRGVVALGISGGLVPCPSALVVLLAAVALHRIVFGLLLIVAFSLGLALVLTGIGVALAQGAPLLSRVPRGGRLRPAWRAARLLPVASAVIVLVAGVGLTTQAIPAVMR